MKKLLACCIAIIAVFGTYSISYADSNSEKENTEDIPQIFIDDRNYVLDNWDKFMPEDEKSGRVKRSIPVDRNSIGDRGDILTSYNSVTGHAGLVVDRWSVIEANKNIGVEMRANEWPVRYSKIKALRVKNATRTDEKRAVEYAQKQLGEDYTIQDTTKFATDKWYCSKLVWRSFYEQGIDLDNNGGPFVTVKDLLRDNDTYIFASIGY